MSEGPLLTRWPAHGPDETTAVQRVLRAGPLGISCTNYHTGLEGRAFEAEWARNVVGLPHALAVSNGTTALECAMRGLGLAEVRLAYEGSGPDEVIVPARTFIATASAVVQAGGKPVLADIDADSLCVTPETLEARRTGATVGIVVVHYAGLPCPRMDEIVRWAWGHGLWIVEDCAHAHGAAVGRASHVAAWSTCVGKIISTGGEGGMVACLDDAVAARMRAYRDHGRYSMTAARMDGGVVGTEFEWTVDEFGSNARMTEMQAAIGRVQLRGLRAQIARRQEIAAAYDAVLGSAAAHTPEQRAAHVRYMYIAQVSERAAVMRALIERGIPARIGGCPNIGRENAFLRRAWEWPCPVADAVGERTLALPVYPTMTDAEVGRVCQALREVLG